MPRQPMVGSLVVPYMVDATRRPIDFKLLDTDHVDRCAKHRRCGICGRRIQHGRTIAFIGPADGRSCFGDPWMHPECAALAAQQCPFIRGRDWRDEDARGDALLRPYSDGMVIYHATDARAHRGPAGEWHFEAINPQQERRVPADAEP